MDSQTVISHHKMSVRQLLLRRGHKFDLRLVAGDAGLDNTFSTAELNRPGLAFAGFYEVFSHDRIQILGNTEISYLRNLAATDRHARLEHALGFHSPCFIVTSGQKPPTELAEIATIKQVAILTTSLNTSRLTGMLTAFLEQEFAPSTNIHGTLMDVFGMGVLLMGKSGVGKSECALELIERGHRLVADDVVVLRRFSKEVLMGSSSELLQYHMEIRGIGIIDVEALYGIGAVREEERISLMVRLEKWDDAKEYERLGLDERTTALMDVVIPEYVIPVEPGRNLSILIEVAALNQRLKNQGINPAQRFNERLLERMTTKSGGDR
ncbi:MAG: HPr(Ser) kinase/phosphatase [bacterium]